MKKYVFRIGGISLQAAITSIFLLIVLLFIESWEIKTLTIILLGINSLDGFEIREEKIK